MMIVFGVLERLLINKQTDHFMNAANLFFSLSLGFCFLSCISENKRAQTGNPIDDCCKTGNSK